MSKKKTIQKSQAELQESVASLEDRIAQENKTSRVFYLGIVGGFGRAVGATVVFSIVVVLVSAVLYQLGWFPGFNEYISSFRPTELE